MKPKYRNPDYLLACFFGIIASSLGLALALLLMVSIDAATDGDFNRLLMAMLILLGLAVVEYAVLVLFKIFTVRYATKAVAASKNALFASSLKGYGKSDESNIAMFTTNTDVIYNDYYHNHVFVVWYASMMAFSVFGVIFLHWMLFLVAVLASLLTMLAPAIFQKMVARKTQAYSDKSKVYIDSVTDCIAGKREIKSFFAQGFFEKMHSGLNAAAERARGSRGLANFMMQQASQAFGSITFMAIIVAGGFLIINGSITVGVLIAVLNLMNGMVGPIGMISTAIGQMNGSKKIAMDYFIEPETKTGSPVDELKDAIVVKGLTYTYPDAAKPAVENASLRVAKNRAYAIVGESGCGKTTLAKVMAGQLEYDTGQVLYDGKNVSELSPDEYGSRVRYISQAEHLFRLSIKENVELGESSGRYDELIKNLGLDALLERSDEEFREGVELLSAGQKQRIALARALNKMPEVLILDEPTANMDEETAAKVIRYLKSIDNLTLIVITHARSEEILRHFDEVVRWG